MVIGAGELFPYSVTDGQIAAINLESARRRAWTRFAQNAALPGIAETILDLERLGVQFLGDVTALDRLEALASQFSRIDDSCRAALIQAAVASTVHRFRDARVHLERAVLLGGAQETIERQWLAIDQACGVRLDAVEASRRKIATASGRLDDLVPFAAVLGDLERFEEADAVYRKALQVYDGVSPFPLAWVCFQLGALWGELVPVPEPGLAVQWYRRAIDLLPGYVGARVHLAEICLSRCQLGAAASLLQPALASLDPEPRWRLGDVFAAQGRAEAAYEQLEAARWGFEALLEKHPLAFADHAAEFYAGSGDNGQRALQLARENVANRPTRRALDQLRAIRGASRQIRAPETRHAHSG